MDRRGRRGDNAPMNDLALALALSLAASVPLPASHPDRAPTPPAPALLPLHAAATPPRPGGDPQELQIESRILGASRRVLVSLPASFATSAPTHRYPTLVLFDGETLLRPVVIAADELAREGQIPEAVIVGIENTEDPDGRIRDLTPPGLSVSGSSLDEGGDRFLDFVEQELLPALDARFRSSGPRVLVGHSSGGLLATYAAATRDAWRFVLALDGPTHLGDDWLVGKMIQRAGTATARRDPRPLRYASEEAIFGWTDDNWRRLIAAAPPSWMLTREHLAHEGHLSMPFLGSYLGLRELFRDYSQLAAPQSPTASILPSYERLTAAYGAPMVPPRALLRQVVDDLLMEGRAAAAQRALEILVAGYGEPEGGDRLRARIAEVEREPPPSETVEGLLATPFPSPSELHAYLGVWKGEQWINPVARDPFELHLGVEDGKVVGTLRMGPPANQIEVPLQYLRLTPEGLTFGMMNGRRPHGVVLYEARYAQGRLAGEVRFGGIRFVPPDGSRPPKHEFELRRDSPPGAGKSPSGAHQ